MKLKTFSKSVTYTPEFGGNKDDANPFRAIIRPIDMHRLFVITDVYQRAGLNMQGAIDSEAIPVAAMAEIVETLRTDIAPYVKLEGLTDADGVELTMDDVVSYAALYPLAMELFNVLLAKSAPTEDDAKNSAAPPA